MATKTAGPLLALALFAGAACGSGHGSGGQTAGSRLPSDVAVSLAARADEVAAALDRGACDDALAKARTLQSDITTLAAEPAVRAEALAGTARLVSGISCPPPAIAPATAVPAPVIEVPDSSFREEPKKGKGRKR